MQLLAAHVMQAMATMCRGDVGVSEVFMSVEKRRPVFKGIVEDFAGLMGCSRDLWIIYAVKFIESVAYFAVLGVLILYLHDDLYFSDETAGVIFGTWGTLVSLLTFVSGFVADAMGQRKALLVGALTLVVGRALLLASEMPMLALAGLAISVWGVASMKPVMTAAIKTHAPDDLRVFFSDVFLCRDIIVKIVQFQRNRISGRLVTWHDSKSRGYMMHSNTPYMWVYSYDWLNSL